VALEGRDHLESVPWRNSKTDQTEQHKICHVFIMTGADPNTRWLNGCIALDAKGFIKTGPDLSPENLSAAQWRLTHPPHLLETTLPQEFSRWARAQSRSLWFIKYFRSKRDLTARCSLSVIEVLAISILITIVLMLTSCFVTATTGRNQKTNGTENVAYSRSRGLVLSRHKYKHQ